MKQRYDPDYITKRKLTARIAELEAKLRKWEAIGNHIDVLDDIRIAVANGELDSLQDDVRALLKESPTHEIRT